MFLLNENFVLAMIARASFLSEIRISERKVSILIPDMRITETGESAGFFLFITFEKGSCLVGMELEQKSIPGKKIFDALRALKLGVNRNSTDLNVVEILLRKKRRLNKFLDSIAAEEFEDSLQ